MINEHHDALLAHHAFNTAAAAAAAQVYVINCLAACQQTLAGRTAAAGRAQQLAETING